MVFCSPCGGIYWASYKYYTLFGKVFVKTNVSTLSSTMVSVIWSFVWLTGVFGRPRATLSAKVYMYIYFSLFENIADTLTHH